MEMDYVFEGLTKSVVRFPKEFTAGRARHAALAAYEGPEALLKALRSRASHSLGTEGRGAVSLAILIEQQRPKAHRLWGDLLVLAFKPMLLWVRSRAGHKKGEDLDQSVLLAFLEAAGSLQVGSIAPYAVPIALRRATERVIFGAVLAEREEPPMDELDETALPCDPFSDEAQQPLVEAARAELARMLETGADGGEGLKALLATTAGDESLKEYVARTYPFLNAKAGEAVYRRVHGERARVAARLKARLGLRSAA